MSVTAAALADFRFALGFAAETYRIFTEVIDDVEGAEFVVQLANERHSDATVIDEVTSAAEITLGQPTIVSAEVGQLLGLGARPPVDAASAAFRIQRSENSLGRMASLLASLEIHPAIVSALEGISERIDAQKETVRWLRRISSVSLGAREYFQSRKPETEGLEVKIWFGTNRAIEASGSFGAKRSAVTSYGSCRVFVPRNREIGSLGGRRLRTLFRRNDKVTLINLSTLSESDFWAGVAAESAALEIGNRHGLVFLHGYNTKFEDAARRTAQLKFDLGHSGPAAFFSWPSLGAKIGYTVDEAAIEGSEASIQNFLVDFAQKSGAEAVHIIAHSMGNRALLRAMNAIVQSASASAPVQFGQIFLAAPDVDTQLFQNLAAAYTAVSARTTLYVTRNDWAIGLSRGMHNFPRAGLTPPVIVLPGIDTVDASRVNLGIVGHSYVSEMRPILADIHDLMHNNTPPDRRFGIRRAAGIPATHWEFAQ